VAASPRGVVLGGRGYILQQHLRQSSPRHGAAGVLGVPVESDELLTSAAVSAGNSMVSVMVVVSGLFNGTMFKGLLLS
jgi:hypothetical protein